MKTILAIDQGTTSTTAVLIDADTFRFVGKKSIEIDQIYPRPGLVEHNLNNIWESIVQSVRLVISDCNINPNLIQAIGITNQRETVCPFMRDGTPIHNAIVWQDRRTVESCFKLKSKEAMIRQKTGLYLDSYFSASKMAWLIENVPAVQAALKSDELCLSNVDAFVLFKLSDGQCFATEPSNASRTMLMDLASCQWDNELLDIFKIPLKVLPEIKDSWNVFSHTKGLDFLPDGIPISGILGDQQAALLGQACIKSGEAKCTYGTGAFLLLNTGTSIKRADSGLLTTVALRGGGKTFYALEGSCYIAGAAVQWLRDNLQIIATSSESELLAQKVEDLSGMEEVLFLPFFSGLGTPHWIGTAKAAIVGLGRDTSKEHIVRACLEGICFSVNDLMLAMQRAAKIDIMGLKVDGNATANKIICQNQATISNIDIICPQIIETTAYGVSLAAAIGVELCSLDDIVTLWQEKAVFNTSSQDVEYFKRKGKLWSKSIENLYLHKS